MVQFTHFALAAATFLSLATAAPLDSRQTVPATEFTFTWPTEFCNNESYEFHWVGGSGQYNLVATLEFKGQFSPHPGYFLFDSNATSYNFTVPAADPGKPDATYQFQITDFNNAGDSEMGPVVPVRDCSAA